jgi:fructose-specific phosphotransferase system IIC component
MDPLAIIGVFMLGAAAGSVLTYIKGSHIIAECNKALQWSRANMSASADEQVQGEHSNR